MEQFHVAIDGPAGSGKSTISSLIANKLKWTHIDTGAMYRAVTLKALNDNLDLNDENSYRFLENTIITYDNETILLNGLDVTKDIRSKAVTDNVSLVSSFAYVRDKMVFIQREAAKGKKVIMDGRDIGTVVLKNADLKVFLTANIEERAKRRISEFKINGTNNMEAKIQKVIEDIKTRDKKDSTRVESPLKRAEDAIELDTTNLSIDEVVNKIINLIEKKEKIWDGYKSTKSRRRNRRNSRTS